MSNDNNRRNNLGIYIAIFSAVIILVLVVLWFFTNSKEMKISEDVKYGAINGLRCKTSSSENAFFKPYDAIRVEHEIVMTFVGESFNSASYNYLGTYNSDEKAENAEAWLHGDYNMSFRDSGISPERYSPNFASVGSKATISLFFDGSKLSRIVMPILYLTGDDYDKLADLSSEDFRRFYEEKGFTCNFTE